MPFGGYTCPHTHAGILTLVDETISRNQVQTSLWLAHPWFNIILICTLVDFTPWIKGNGYHIPWSHSQPGPV